MQVKYTYGSVLMEDPGFLGESTPEVKVVMPIKKPKGKELTQEQKDLNTNISLLRGRVEHTICSVKRNRIVKYVFKNHKEEFKDSDMLISCGLHNYRLSFIT